MAGNSYGKEVEFETISSERVEFGKNNFIEVARKRAVGKTDSNEFISISRGFLTTEGEARYRKSVTIPDEDEVKEFVAEMLRSI